MDANQLGRRNIQPQQAEFLRGRIYNRRKKKEGAPTGNNNAGKQRDQNDPVVSTAEQVAAETGVSSATVKRNGKMAAEIAKAAYHIHRHQRTQDSTLSGGKEATANERDIHKPTATTEALWKHSPAIFQAGTPSTARSTEGNPPPRHRLSSRHPNGSPGAWPAYSPRPDLRSNERGNLAC